MFERDYDKFQRWLKKYRPDYFDRYKQGENQGEVEVVGFGWGYHLYCDGKLLGTLMER